MVEPVKNGVPRTILYTGKGGVGKTSVAAASARRAAAAGLRTVVLSTDPAHSLSDALQLDLGPDPTPIGDNLWGQEVLAQREMEANWAQVQAWIGKLLVERGVMDIAAEELTVPPGMDELFSLLQIKRHHESGLFDLIIVDCAPTGETLRLLSFPEIAKWWLEKVFPVERRMVAAARPIAKAFLDVDLPGEEVLAEVNGLVRNLIAMNDILRDSERASIRLVMNADRMVVNEAQRTFTYLNLYGYLTDAVIVNRLFPHEVGDGYFGPWRMRQEERLGDIEAGFAPVPVLKARYFADEVVGSEMLDKLGEELFSRNDVAQLMLSERAHEFTEAADGAATIRIRVPFADRSQVSLRQVGSELIVGAGREKRTLILPPALARRHSDGARFADGVLEITFPAES
jgi:arsenite/tail-anchored protein-transporting ATPase